MSESAVLIVNTKSRRGKLWFKQACETLPKMGVSLREAVALKDPSRLPALVEREIACGAERVIVGGGDGTLSAAAKHFLGKETIFGVLPFGTGNQFARDLHIATNVEAACRVIAEGKIMPIDVGTVGEDIFLTVTTAGITTQIARSLTPDTKKRYGIFAYAFAVRQALYKTQPFTAHIETPDETFDCRTVQVVIGNGRYHAGPFLLSAKAAINDGFLNGYALTDTSRLGLVRFALAMMSGRQEQAPGVHLFRAKSVKLATTPVQKVIVDGEELTKTPITIGQKLAAIRVMVPQDFNPEQEVEAVVRQEEAGATAEPKKNSG